MEGGNEKRNADRLSSVRITTSPPPFLYEEQSTRQGDLGSVMCREETKAGKVVNG